MKLYKNVNIEDLESILKKGVLSIRDCGNNNWRDGKRANNADDVVYLFEPAGSINSFVQYGAALLEIEVNSPTEAMMDAQDVNIGKYREFTVQKISTEQIKAIYIPKIFEGKDELNEAIAQRVTYCEIEAEVYCSDANEWMQASEMDFAPLLAYERFTSTDFVNYFRGINHDNTMVDYRNFTYKI